MTQHLRFTGELPPPKLWARYPNWSCALEEEGFDDQDESTLRPSDNQKVIDWEVVWTVVDVVFANGKSVPAIAQVMDGEMDWIHVYPDPRQNKAWVLWFSGPKRKCVAIDKDWGSKGAHLPVPVDDPNVFPLRVISRLRYKRKSIVEEVKKAYKQ